MIDSTKSPVPAWKRFATLALVTLLVVVAGYMIWTKELKHKGLTHSSSQAGTSQVSPAPAPAKTSTTPTTVGLPLSSRNPFGS